ncbi:hydroxyethylthiazole kinase [Legionella maioricensis]|uniref:hydroxyethylthiazole kinase n=1 Tax=Legionella maioricensis TaxID=2896528 RepID=A0A9X2CZX5_9GAMM|nr:hydroxyethylthiazole kinase [Legionella maioricensis]MCL9683836.1 hydroxyethylthiazole kinase [Legionella maioricensis]MCL9686683.1 hydroxyethylthiazole kinase [Legionella maioricensis]
MTQKINEILTKIKLEKPLIFNCSDYYSMELIVSGIRSLGAFPIMSNAEQEIEELLKLSKSVVINLGKLDDAFITLSNRICQIANEINIPIILDPVGTGASRYRTDTAIDLISNHKISIVRGYPNEISGLLTGQLTMQHNNPIDINTTVEHARSLSEKHNLTVVVSGKRHIVIDSKQLNQFNFDSLLLQKVAGISSLLSSIIGVFHAIEPDRFIAAKTAVNFYANCVGPTSSKAAGPASLMTELIDRLYITSSKVILF